MAEMCNIYSCGLKIISLWRFSKLILYSLPYKCFYRHYGTDTTTVWCSPFHTKSHTKSALSYHISCIIIIHKNSDTYESGLKIFMLKIMSYQNRYFKKFISKSLSHKLCYFWHVIQYFIFDFFKWKLLKMNKIK